MDHVELKTEITINKTGLLRGSHRIKTEITISKTGLLRGSHRINKMAC